MGFLGIFGDDNAAHIKKLDKIANKVEALEGQMQSLSDEALRGKTDEFRARLASGKETLDDLLPEAFAVVREGAVRVLSQRPFHVQLIGGIVLHQGRIAEMKTGEGKTLTATLPAYLNALEGKGVHIVTVNEYLAGYQSELMGKLFNFLGMTVGNIYTGMSQEERRAAYQADITYGTNSEFGFDYLRDNMAIYKEARVQRELRFAIVDEVDSILIDEARTPLIISGRGNKSTEMYAVADKIVRNFRLKPETEEGEPEGEGDFTMDEKSRTVSLTEDGVAKVERALQIDNLSDPENTEKAHYVNQALKANFLFKRDRDYIVTDDGQVKIVDEFTGRILEGRRYSEGLHQAIEAKESVKVKQEDQTLATITYQNYFRMYHKLSGMTGTAKTEEEEFESIYALDVVCVPTNKPMIRQDLNDRIYKDEACKFNAVVEEIIRRHATGQPILVGTVSVEKSELLSGMLRRKGVRHEVLNAKHHAKEAEIVAQAGRLNAVTIATNMAGRGTDILLGGNPDFLSRNKLRGEGYDEVNIDLATGHQATDDALILEIREKYNQLYTAFKKETDEEHEKVVQAGGLCIIGTERHESRRIDNQLRGRSGRQGDPGASVFFISFDDDVMRLFGGDRMKAFVSKILPEEGNEPIEAGMLSRQIENAQKKVESHNFEIRKNVLQYDDVMNVQRGIIYEQRRKVLEGEDVRDSVMDMMHQIVERTVNQFTANSRSSADWDLKALYEALCSYCMDKDTLDPASLQGLSENKLKEALIAAAEEKYAKREELIASVNGNMRAIEREILLRCVDRHWMDHIDAMDQLRQGISLRAMAQRDPVQEYKMEGFDMFEEMTAGIQEDTVRILWNSSINIQPQRQSVATPTHAGNAEDKPQAPGKKMPAVRQGNVGRNDPCPCGSGKKYKNCCGKNA